MRKVMTIVGTRPELIKLSRVIAAFDSATEHVLVHTGQNYDHELNQIFFDDLGIRKPDHFLGASGASAAQTIANVIAGADRVLEQERPDALLLYGDTNSCLAVIAAKRRKVPVFHMEAGNRCFDERVPEELNRKVLDHLSDINFVLTEHARRYLIAEGIRPEKVFKTGSHMPEVLAHHAAAIEASGITAGLGLERGRFFLVSAHREENVDSEENLASFLATLEALVAEHGMPVIVSTHPRTRKRIEASGRTVAAASVRFLNPFGFTDYIRLQQDAYCVLSDSGTITEEAALLDLPAVMLRNAHERPEGMDAGLLIMCGLRPDRVLDAVRTVIASRARPDRIVPVVDDYPRKSVSDQILKVVLSYIDYIDRTVWSKPPV